MVQTLEQGDIFGRIGRAFGEGAGAGAEKQFGANRVAKALEPVKGEEFNPLTTTQRLIRANASPQEIASYLPLLQQEQARKEAFQPRPEEGVNIPTEAQPSQTVAGKISPTAAGKEFKPLQRTDEALWKRAAELSALKPSLYRDPNVAYNKALSEYQGEQDILSKTEKQFNQSIEKKAQKYGIDIDKDIPGDMQQAYLREAQALAATGKESPEKVADKISKDLLDFAKARTNLKSLKLNSASALVPKTAEQLKLNAIRKEYEDKEQLELFENDLINEQGLSPAIASYIAFPIKENKEINNFAQDTKKRFSLNPLGPLVTGLKEKGGKGTKKRTEKEIGEFIGKNLKDEDSLNSIAMAFSAKGYDPQLILNEIQNNPKIRLNKRQEQDLQKRPNFRPTLKDISFFAASGLQPQEIIP